MNKSFLKYYNDELFYLRELGEEFAHENPHIAENLSLSKFDCVDPYIERLLEGFAYMAARVHSKLDSEFPRFTQTLINNIYPQYLMPVPAISTVEFKPDFGQSSLVAGVTIPKGSMLRSKYRNSKGTSCYFTTGHNVNLWPIKIDKVNYFSDKAANINIKGNIKSYLSIDLECTGGNKFSDLSTDNLDFYMFGSSIKVLMDLYELIFTNTASITIQYEDDNGNELQVELNDLAEQLLPLGFSESESLLPYESRTFQAYRLLREYFIAPKRFLYFRLDKINDAFQYITSNKLKIIFSMTDVNYLLENSLSKENFSLYSTPVVNLFNKKLDRIILSGKKPEIHVIGDKTKVEDYEIINLKKITGYNNSNTQTVNYKPFYSETGFDRSEESSTKYYSEKREFKTVTETSGKEVSCGTEMYLSLTETESMKTDNDTVELGIDALCSNRNIPLEIPLATKSKSDFDLSVQYPILGVKFIERISAPVYSHLNNTSNWAVINHLKIDYNSLSRKKNADNTEIVRDLLKLYADPRVLFDKKQILGLLSVKVDNSVKLIQNDLGVSFTNGLQFKVEFNEASFNDTSFLILANILHHLFKNGAPINSFVETIVNSSERGIVKKWTKKLY